MSSNLFPLAPTFLVLLALACNLGVALTSAPTPNAVPTVSSVNPASTQAPSEAPLPSATAPLASSTAEPGPGPNTYWVMNPTSGAKLYVEVIHPQNWNGQPLPTFILIPGGNGFSQDFKEGRKSARLLADAGFMVILFDPDGRGRSEGAEDYDGYVHQDGLAAITLFATTLPEVEASQIGHGSFSYGVTMAAGALARYPDLPVRFLIDWEGPADRADTGGCGGDVRGHLAEVATCTDEDFWAAHEALTFISQIRVPYQRLQTVKDHVQPDYDHTIRMVNAAVEGGAPWVRLNDLEPNRTYDLANPPKMLPENFDRNLMEAYAQLGKELLALALP